MRITSAGHRDHEGGFCRSLSKFAAERADLGDLIVRRPDPAEIFLVSRAHARGHQRDLAAPRGGAARARRLCHREGRRALSDVCDGGRSGTHGIRVNAIAPGPTLTGLTRASYTDPKARRATEAVIPLGRLGQPDDLVGAVLFLASDESR
ncbi:MAG TPA: SDR family oxidoreductase [Xanthobacteraceae bacterium]|nr:SDR family oxidoreductase [Xanthobacteraceae bacterium]